MARKLIFYLNGRQVEARETDELVNLLEEINTLESKARRGGKEIIDSARINPTSMTLPSHDASAIKEYFRDYRSELARNIKQHEVAKTKARIIYALALQNYEEGNFSEARNLYDQAKSIYPRLKDRKSLLEKLDQVEDN